MGRKSALLTALEEASAVTYTPTQKQREFLEHPAKFRAFVGGVGSGKTTAGCMEVIRCLVQYPGSVGLMGRKVWRDFYQTTLAVFYELIPPAIILRDDKEIGYIMVRSCSGEPSHLFLRSFDDPKKLEGMNLGFFFIDEAVEVDEEFFKRLIGRLRHPVGPRRGWIASTPPPTSHWIFKRFVASHNPNYAVIQASTYDNPYLPQDYIKTLEENFGGEFKQRFILGHWGFDREGAPVFPNFDPSIHVVKHEELDIPEVLYRGIDFGFRNPAAVWGYMDEWGRLIIIDEFLGEMMTIDAFLHKLASIDQTHYPHSRVIADYHDPHSTYKTDLVWIDRAEAMRRHGFVPIAASGGSVEYGITVISRLLDTLVMRHPLLRISSKCNLLIEAFMGGYCWDETGKHIVDSVYTHIMDALRYLVVGLYPKIFKTSSSSKTTEPSRYALSYMETFKF